MPVEPRVLFYVQHLSGVGHHVRTREIARAMSDYSQVWMCDGGCTVPSNYNENINMLTLPRIERQQGKLKPLVGQDDIQHVMAVRKSEIEKAIYNISPDAIVVEHYPFSKWGLADEILPMLNAARKANQNVKIFCSVRDIPLQTSHEICNEENYVKEVLNRLHAQFDTLLIHADRRISNLGQFFSASNKIKIPITHTGIVTEPLRLNSNNKTKNKYIVASMGGGKDAAGLLVKVRNAWQLLRQKGKLTGYQLIMFDGIEGKNSDVIDDCDGVIFRPFSADYLQWLQACELSISCAGYNTCSNILNVGCRAIFLPNIKMSDQVARTKIMQNLGYAALLQVEPTPEILADMMIQCLGEPVLHPSVNLNGAKCSADFIKSTLSI
jgi:predicted glycosyltransferase